ncbi:MAG: hypothetical protein AAGF04_01895 [Chlamydiota bacterium]
MPENPEPIVFVKTLGGLKYRVVFPSIPKKIPQEGKVAYEARVGKKVYRLMYEPDVTKLDPFFRDGLEDGSHRFMIDLEHGICVLSLKSGSAEEFRLFRNSFSLVETLDKHSV